MKQPKLTDLKIDVAGTEKIRAQMAKSKKIKITINLDEEILAAVREEAGSTGVPYQNLVNRLLKQALNEKKDDSDRLDKLEKEVRALKKKMTA